MTDPAIEAANRAIGMCMAYLHLSPRIDIATLAAREALAPLRARHKASKWEWCGEVMVSCFECGRVWPCATAKLVYPAEELR